MTKQAVAANYEVRIASLRVSDIGWTRPSLSRFRPCDAVTVPTGSARSGRSRSTTCSRVRPAPMRSGKGEQWWEDDHDGGGPQGEDGKVGGLPALEPVEPAASCEESGGEQGGPGQVHEEDEVEA